MQLLEAFTALCGPRSSKLSIACGSLLPVRGTKWEPPPWQHSPSYSGHIYRHSADSPSKITRSLFGIRGHLSCSVQTECGRQEAGVGEKDRRCLETPKPYTLCPRLEACFDLPCLLNSVDWLPLPELDCKVRLAFMRLSQSPLLKDLQTGPSVLVVRKCTSKMPWTGLGNSKADILSLRNW